MKSSPGRIRTVDPLFVRQVPSPLGHRTVFVLWSGGPTNAARQCPLEPTSLATGSFQNCFLTSSGDLHKHRGQESNLRPSGSEPDATTNSCYPGSISAPPANRTLTNAVQSRTAAPAVGECERRESNPSSSGWKPDILPLNYARNFKRKERESNPQGSFAHPASNARAITNWLAFPPSSAPAAGIEPA